MTFKVGDVVRVKSNNIYKLPKTVGVVTEVFDHGSNVTTVEGLDPHTRLDDEIFHLFFCLEELERISTQREFNFD